MGRNTRWESRLTRWLVPEGSDALPRPDAGPAARVVAPMRDFVGAVLRQPSRPDVREARRRRRSPCLESDLFLALASRSQEMFRAGPVDELSMVQRKGVSLRHDVEFLTRLDPEDAGSERYGAYGVIRLYRGGRRLPHLDDARGFWETLRADYGLTRLPAAADLLQRTCDGSEKVTRWRVAPPRSARVFDRVGMRRFYYGDVLDILRQRLTSPQVVAWIEASLRDVPAPGEVIHRYYMTRSLRVLLVRHHWSQGKRLFRAETSAEARRLVEQSGAFSRLRAA